MTGKKIKAFSGRIPYQTQASYDPELEAIKWALMMVPLNVSLKIYVDNKATIEAIQGSPEMTKENRLNRYRAYNLDIVGAAIRARDLGVQSGENPLQTHIVGCNHRLRTRSVCFGKNENTGEKKKHLFHAFEKCLNMITNVLCCSTTVLYM